MSIITIVLSLLALISAILTIHAALSGSKPHEYVFKPLTMVLIIALAALETEPTSDTYHRLIIAGLIASLVGDVALMFPGDRWFLGGLVAFLGGHVLYIAAFNQSRDGDAAWYYLLPFVLYGALMLWWLWPHLGTMRLPVIVYVAVIMIMAWQAANRWLIDREADATLVALVGAYLFVASDSVLAVDRFRGSWRSARLWVLSMYFAAQWLLALSV
ncbi:MAG: lysoplasmalogenase [Anaerolineae bacterium]|nr:lysoplasmalogenase [Anaerolineae bacterium]